VFFFFVMNAFFICSFVSIAFFIFISYDYFLQPIVPVTQPSGRGGRRNFASSNSYQGSLCSFVDTFQISIVVLFPVLSSLLTFRYR